MAEKRTRYLNLRGLKWWFKRDIPAAIRPHFEGRTAYLVNLETGDIRAAQIRRDALARETDRLFGNARRGTVGDHDQDAIRQLGEQWAAELKASLSDPVGWAARAMGQSPESVEDEYVLDAHSVIEDVADQVQTKHGTAERDRFLSIVSGRVDVDHYLQSYLTEAGLAPKTTDERRNLIRRFAVWAKAEGYTLQDVKRSQAGAYFTQAIAPLHRSTGKKHLGSVKLYWDYLAKRGHVRGANPWEGQAMPNRLRRVERGSRDVERPFTQDEMRKLLYAEFPHTMRDSSKSLIRDAMMIAALSGMRLAEIITLLVDECDLGDNSLFDIQQGKTSAAARQVPIHPALLEIVQRRTKGKPGKGWLFHEMARHPDPGDAFGKRFRTYRKAMGVDDKREGKRRSLVNFHSFRRWFVTEAERAGQQESIIAEVVGHEEGRKSITFKVYSAGPSLDQKRRCVEAVVLPPPV